MLAGGVWRNSEIDEEYQARDARGTLGFISADVPIAAMMPTMPAKVKRAYLLSYDLAFFTCRKIAACWKNVLRAIAIR